jgi:hypothetical protein
VSTPEQGITQYEKAGCAYLMLEYRVIYYSDKYENGIGSPQEPWISYEDTDAEEAYEMYRVVTEDLPDQTVKLQSREVSDWETVDTCVQADTHVAG